MKFQVNDQVVVTGGKDKGKKSTIIEVLPKTGRVIVAGANMYTKHVRKMQGRAGEIVRKERPLPTANVAILNEKGQPDRIGYQIVDGKKQRIYKKTKTVIATEAAAKKTTKKVAAPTVADPDEKKTSKKTNKKA